MCVIGLLRQEWVDYVSRVSYVRICISTALLCPHYFLSLKRPERFSSHASHECMSSREFDGGRGTDIYSAIWFNIQSRAVL